MLSPIKFRPPHDVTAGCRGTSAGRGVRLRVGRDRALVQELRWRSGAGVWLGGAGAQPHQCYRYHLVTREAQKLAARNPRVGARAEALIARYERKLVEHRFFIRNEGVDPPEIAAWRWRIP